MSERYLRVPPPRSVVEGSKEFSVLRVELRTAGDQLIDGCEVAVARCDLQAVHSARCSEWASERESKNVATCSSRHQQRECHPLVCANERK